MFDLVKSILKVDLSGQVEQVVCVITVGSGAAVLDVVKLLLAVLVSSTIGALIGVAGAVMSDNLWKKLFLCLIVSCLLYMIIIFMSISFMHHVYCEPL